MGSRVAAASAAFVLAACSSSVVAPTVAVVPATPTPIPIPSTAPFAVQTQAPIVATGGAVTLAAPASGVAARISYVSATSSATSGTTLVASLQNTVPAGFPALAALRRLSTVPASPLWYLELVASGEVTLSGTTAALDVPAASIVTGAAYYLAFFDPGNVTAQWQRGFAGPATVTAGRLTFVLPPLVALHAATTYAYAVYAVPASVPSPTVAPSASASASASPAVAAVPSPSASPASSPSPSSSAPSSSPSPSPSPTSTPTPSGVVVASPAAISITTSGAGGAKSISVSEAGYAGAFTETDSCATPVLIASISGSSPSWTATGIANGTCVATFRDVFGNVTTVSVSVSGAGFTISSRGRSPR